MNPARKEVVGRVMEFTNLLGIKEKKLVSLSKGMKQRVSLARAIVHDPNVLVLDEPAAGLDPRARVELRELLKALAAQGKAILISSHILSELAEICDGAVIIERGKLLKAGTMEELVSGLSSRVLVVRPSSRLEDVHRELLQMPAVKTARIDGKLVEAEFDGADNVAGGILATLVGKGYEITEFHQRKIALEDVFMKVTEGGVQ